MNCERHPPAADRLRIAAWWLFSAGLALLAPARTGTAEELPPATAPLAVADVFTGAHLIRTPPLLEKLPEPKKVVDEAFAADSLEGWTVDSSPEGTEVRVAADAEARSGGRSLLVRAGAGATELPRVTRRIPARPKAPYRLTAFVRTRNLEPRGAGGAGASVELAELGDEAGGAPLVIHRHLPRERGTSLDWKRIEYTFRTSEATREIAIDLVAALGPATGEARFDDVTVEEVPLITDVLGRDPYLDHTRGADPHPLVRRINLDGRDERPSILAPPSTRWRLPVAPAADTILRTALSILPLGAPSRFCFTVDWHSEGTSTQLAKLCLDGAPTSSPGWREILVDLTPYAGRQGTLVFSSTGAGGGVGLWGNPRLVARSRRPEDERPNLVLLVVDTLRADHLGVEGYEHRPTSPQLDRLARRSVRFSRAYSTSPWTTPSFASILTSRYPAQHRGGMRIERERHLRSPEEAFTGGEAHKSWKSWEVRLLSDLFERATTLKFHGIDRGEDHLAERLRAAGYATVAFHSNYNLSGLVGTSRGFDRYQLYWNSTPSGAYEGVSLVQKWLKGRRLAEEEGPFFLLFHVQEPHMPYRMRREQAAAFAVPGTAPGSLPEETETVRRLGDWAFEFWNYKRLREDGGGDDLARAVAFYDAAIAHADRALGDLLAELGPETAVVLVADHGEEFGDHGEFEHGHSLYNEIVRVPFFLHLPGGRRAGTVVGEPVSLVDVAPTLLELAGARPLPAAEGRSLLSLKERPRKRQGILAESMLRGPDRTALVEGRYKYVLTHPMGYLDPFYNPFGPEPRLEEGRSRNVGKEELYDLVDDPGETRNLIASRSGVAARLGARVRSYLEETVPGLHLRCRAGGAVELTLAFTESMSYLKPLTLEEDDEVEIDPARHRVVLRLAEDRGDEDAFVVRLARAEGELRLGSGPGRLDLLVGSSGRPARAEALRLGDPSLAGPPAPRPDGVRPWCQLWEVAGPDPPAHSQLDATIADGLRALGYL